MEDYQDKGAAERHYLLGELAEDEQQRFEEELMSGTRSFEELLAAEDELIDQYVANTLDERARERFEQHFLATPERRRKLSFAYTLRRYVADAALAETAVEGETAGVPSASPSSTAAAATPEASSEEEAPAGDDRPRPASTWARLVPPYLRSRAATAFVLLLVFSVAALFIFLRGPRTGGQVIAFTLTPGAVRGTTGGVTQLQLTPGTGAVELRLRTPADAHRRYRADILTLDHDRPVYSTPDEIEPTASGTDALVNVRLPATLLAPGDYKLNLTGAPPNGNFEDIATYYFRIAK